MLNMNLQAKRDSSVFEGQTGLIVTGVLTGVGTLVCLVLLTVVIIYVRKRYKRRYKAHASQNSFNKIKERMSSENGHPILKSHFSHTPPIGKALSPTPQPSLRITDLHRQPSSGFFQSSSSPAPFQPDTLIQSRSNAPSQSPFQPYSSSIPLATASPRRKAFQSYEGNANSVDRPNSYLPVHRGLTPLSMSFVSRGKSASPSASVSSRPGIPTVPSSDLIHASQQGHLSGNEGGQETVSSPFISEVDQSAFRGQQHQHVPHGDVLPHSAHDTWNQSSSSQIPASSKLNFSYPTAVMQAPLSTHTHSRSEGHKKIDMSSDAMRHLRNRSTGTVITYASSAFSNYSNVTTKIQPVVFNDSPRSSVSVEHYQPNGRYAAAPVKRQMKATTCRPRAQSTSKLASDRTTMQDSKPSPEVQQDYKFTDPSTPSQAEPTSHDPGGLTAPSAIERKRRFKRRASGTLPDMLFARTPSNEGLAEPASLISLGQEDMATIEDESVLDPMDQISRRQSRHLYADLRLSANSSVASYNEGDETLKNREDGIHPLLCIRRCQKRRS